MGAIRLPPSVDSTTCGEPRASSSLASRGKTEEPFCSHGGKLLMDVERRSVGRAVTKFRDLAAAPEFPNPSDASLWSRHPKLATRNSSAREDF